MRVNLQLTGIKVVDEKLKSIARRQIIIGVNGNGSEGKDFAKIAEYAYWNDRGTKNGRIPSRPFFTSVIEKQGSDIQRYFKGRISSVINGDSANSALDATGLYIKGLIQTSIMRGTWTPNAPKTLLYKLKHNGSYKQPLISSGSMIKAINFEVKDK